MKNHEDSQALLVEGCKKFQGLHLMSDIEVTDRLIQKEHPWILCYALGKVNLLPFALRKRVYDASAQLAYFHTLHHFTDDLCLPATITEPFVKMRVPSHENELLG